MNIRLRVLTGIRERENVLDELRARKWEATQRPAVWPYWIQCPDYRAARTLTEWFRHRGEQYAKVEHENPLNGLVMRIVRYPNGFCVEFFPMVQQVRGHIFVGPISDPREEYLKVEFPDLFVPTVRMLAKRSQRFR